MGFYRGIIPEYAKARGLLKTSTRPPLNVVLLHRILRASV